MAQSDSLKIAFILGTRPEILKLYSVMIAAREHKEIIPIFIYTGQHYDHEMSQIFLEELKLPKIHYFLNVRSGSHSKQTAALLTAIEKTLKSEKPDAIVIEGDTNTALAGALAGSKLQIPVSHVEAGCRSFDLFMPEEINRLTIDAISSILFAPSRVSALNLLFEGKPENRVFLAGNTVVDLAEVTAELRKNLKLPDEVRSDASVLVTLHRQENVDEKKRLTQLLKAFDEINGEIVFPIHPRTKKRINTFGLRGFVKEIDNLHIIKPLNYLSFMKLLEEVEVVITDSGGVQEEAIIVGTPCVTVRDTTEWPETVWANGNHLAGKNAKNVTKLCNELLKKSAKKFFSARNPFKGNAGPKIIQILTNLWSKNELWLPKPDMSQGRYPLPQLIYDKPISTEFYTTLKFTSGGEALVKNEKSIDRKIIRGYGELSAPHQN